MSRVQITDEIRAELKRLNAETGVGTWGLLGGRKDIPDGLDSSIIAGWLHRNVGSAKKVHIDYVLKHWRSVEPILPVTSEMIAHYKNEVARTGLSATRFIRVFGKAPKGFSKPLLDALSTGKRKSIRASHWDFICTSFASQDDLKTR